jgi:hypothetical protein
MEQSKGRKNPMGKYLATAEIIADLTTPAMAQIGAPLADFIAVDPVNIIAASIVYNLTAFAGYRSHSISSTGTVRWRRNLCGHGLFGSVRLI